MPIVILRDIDNQRALPIWVGPVEANAIALQIENVAPPRPMTHDLLRNVLDELGATLARVVIADLRDGTFYAYLELHRERGSDLRRRAAQRRALRCRCGPRRPSSSTPSARSGQVRRVSSDQADRERLQRWLESLDPDDLGYKM